MGEVSICQVHISKGASNGSGPAASTGLTPICNSARSEIARLLAWRLSRSRSASRTEAFSPPVMTVAARTKRDSARTTSNSTDALFEHLAAVLCLGHRELEVLVETKRTAPTDEPLLRHGEAGVLNSFVTLRLAGLFGVGGHFTTN